nr:unnamed protein product [Callosobruchus chinensis]
MMSVTQTTALPTQHPDSASRDKKRYIKLTNKQSWFGGCVRNAIFFYGGGLTQPGVLLTHLLAAAPTTLSILDAVQRRTIRLIDDPALTYHLQPLFHRRWSAVDGSKIPKGVGSAFVIMELDRTKSIRVPDLSSVFTAEATAIAKSLQWSIDHNVKHIAVLSDSKSVLQSLASSKLTNIFLICKIESLNLNGSKIKGHTEILGNERADQAAKNAIHSITASNFYSNESSHIRRNCKIYGRKENFGVAELKQKIKNLRFTYNQEVGKIKKSNKSGTGWWYQPDEKQWSFQLNNVGKGKAENPQEQSET